MYKGKFGQNLFYFEYQQKHLTWHKFYLTCFIWICAHIFSISVQILSCFRKVSEMSMLGWELQSTIIVSKLILKHLTNSVDLCSFWDAGSRPTGQEIPLLLEPNVYFRVNKIRPLHPLSASWIKSTHIHTCAYTRTFPLISILVLSAHIRLGTQMISKHLYAPIIFQHGFRI